MGLAKLLAKVLVELVRFNNWLQFFEGSHQDPNQVPGNKDTGQDSGYNLTWRSSWPMCCWGANHGEGTPKIFVGGLAKVSGQGLSQGRVLTKGHGPLPKIVHIGSNGPRPREGLAIPKMSWLWPR